jgi:sugar O-acyltransferase (sialic acid O-acetyltransferase NeuD family)
MSGRPDLWVIGTGGLAKEAAQLARRIDPGRWNRIAYVAADPVEVGRELPYGRVECCDADFAPDDADVVIGIGEPALRRRVAQRLRARTGLRFPNLIHPTLEIETDQVRLGIGNMLTRGVVATCEIVIGDFNLFNWNSTIGHDARVGSYNVVNPGSSISGLVRIGDACLLGTGCRILERLSVASEIRVGAGAVVTHDLVDAGTYVGMPARKVGA